MHCVYVFAQCTALCCKDCSVLIANIRDVFMVSVAETNGPLAIHVNPGGVVSELITVTTVASVSLSGFPVLQDTWYPGYIYHPTQIFCHCVFNNTKSSFIISCVID